MKLEEAGTSGKLITDCMACGRDFEIEDFRGEFFEKETRRCLTVWRYCPDCEARERKKKAEEAAAAAERLRRAAFRDDLPRHMKEAGIPLGYLYDRESGKVFTEPLVRFAAEWLWKHRSGNILLSGETGSGKSTSACFVAMKLLEEGMHVRYWLLGDLLNCWREARRSERGGCDRELLNRLRHGADITIIDEVVGKARISESGQELLFDLLETVNNGGFRGKLWLLGNFYTGSIEEIFADGAPVRRRLQENFLCALIDRRKRSVRPITVWKGEK